MAKSSLLVAALLALGCAGVPLTFQEELDDAREAWGVLEMCPVVLRVRDADLVADHCGSPSPPPGFPADARVEGCSKISECKIYIADDVTPERRRRIIQHELGHLLKGNKGHLLCQDSPGDDRMCPDGGGPWVEDPTDRDIAFVKAP